jgi:LysR family transcriptional regulator, glycine cleavage system transcriptional activator
MQRQLPPLNALLAFETAARLGRMTAAAQVLHVTPGAVSRQVKNLETWLGVPLFEGTKNNPVLTATGQALLPRLSLAFDQLHSAAQDAIPLSASRANSLTVSCYNTLAAKWLLPRMQSLAAIHPDMDVQLSASSDVNVQRLQTYDVVILAESVDAVDVVLGSGAKRHVLFAEQLGPVISTELHQRKPTQPIRKAQDMYKLPLLHTQSRPEAWATWAAASGVAAPKAGKRNQFQHYYFTLEAALRGLGACAAPQHLVMDDIAAGRLVAPLGFVPSGLHYVALTKPQPGAVVQDFCRWLVAQSAQVQTQ